MPTHLKLLYRPIIVLIARSIVVHGCNNASAVYNMYTRIFQRGSDTSHKLWAAMSSCSSAAFILTGAVRRGCVRTKTSPIVRDYAMIMSPKQD